MARKVTFTRTAVRRMRLAVAKTLSLSISEGQARAILKIDPDLESELNESGNLDTLPRSDLADAFIELVMPGKPSATDELIGERQPYWHWPCNGSSDGYRNAFYRVLRAALKTHGITPLESLE